MSGDASNKHAARARAAAGICSETRRGAHAWAGGSSSAGSATELSVAGGGQAAGAR